ncbi:MAG: hypothetical protein HKN11_21250 [Rhizobiales bacterium]|nr:hypothetical protein [Hyphomicrobiales bacterium]
MYISDDAGIDEVVQKTVAAITEGARHVGKADQGLTPEQIGKIEVAIKLLQNMLDLKK